MKTKAVKAIPLSNGDLFADDLPIDSVEDSRATDTSTTKKLSKKPIPKTHGPQNETPKKRGRPKKITPITEDLPVIVESGACANPDVCMDTDNTQTIETVQPLNYAVMTSSRTQAKVFSLVEGKLQKTAIANATSGNFRACQAASLAEFAVALDNITASESIILGAVICNDGTPLEVGEKISLTTSKTPKTNAIPRTKDHVKNIKQAGFMLGDLDGNSASYQDLQSIYPELNGIGAVIKSSSSSKIYTQDGVELVGDKGRHIYVPVLDMSDLERIAPVLWDRQWLAGHGHYLISKGVRPMLLERGIYDNSVLGKSERLAFEAPPILNDGLTQSDNKAVVIDGAILDTRRVLDLSADELAQVEQLKQQAKEAIRLEHKLAIKVGRKAYVTKVMAEGKPVRDALAEYKNFEQRELPRDFQVTTAKGLMRVGDLTAKHDGLTMCDPLEPDYDGGSLTKAKFYWNEGKNPIINSQAHGGIKYKIITAVIPVDTFKPSDFDRPFYWCHSEKWKDGGGYTREAGVWYHGLSKGENPVPIDEWICGELHVTGIARDKAGRSFGQVLRFKNKLGDWRIWNIPCRLLAGRGVEVLEELADMGISYSYHKRAQIAAYICSVHPTKTVWTTSQVGWFDKHNFVLPDTTIGQDKDGILFQSESILCLTESGHSQEYDTAGTLEQWRDNAASLCVGNALMVFATSVAFAGALLKPCNMDGVGFHIFGVSSLGKSTGLKLAVSVWGNDKKIMKTWKATANGLEGAASQSNDGLLAIDEMGDCEPKELSDSLYLLGNGKGKQRANVTGGARAIRTWQVATLSNGECDIQTHLAKKGFTVKAGQLVRMIQIPVFGQYGAFDNLHGQHDGRGFSDTVKEKANTFYGVAGRAYLEKLTRDHDTLEQLTRHLDTALNKLTAQFPSLSPQELRTARAFSLVAVAGELATNYGITGWNEGAAFESALTCFEQWRGYRGNGDTEGLQIIEAVTAYIEMYGDARFTSTTDDRVLHGERSGYWKDGIHGRVWMFSKSGLMKATIGYDITQVVNALRAAGMLMLDGQGKSTKPVMFKNNETGDSRFYFICFDSNSSIEKTGVSGVSGVSAYSGAASTLTPAKIEGVSGVSVNHETLINTNTANTYEKTGVSATAHAACGTNTTNTANTEKNNTQSETEEKINSRSNVFRI